MRRESGAVYGGSIAEVELGEKPDGGKGQRHREQRRVVLRKRRGTHGMAKHRDPDDRRENHPSQRRGQSDSATYHGASGRRSLPHDGQQKNWKIGGRSNREGKADHECDVLVLGGNAHRFGDRAESCGGRPRGENLPPLQGGSRAMTAA